jgi:hypothetical protein
MVMVVVWSALERATPSSRNDSLGKVTIKACAWRRSGNPFGGFCPATLPDKGHKKGEASGNKAFSINDLR